MGVVKELALSMRSQEEESTILIHIVLVIELRRTFNIALSSHGRALSNSSHHSLVHYSSISAVVRDDMNVVLTSESSTDSTRASRVSSPSSVSAVGAHVRVGTVHQHVSSQTLLVQFLFVDIVPLGLEEVRVCNELFLVQVLLLFLVKGLGELI